MNSHEVRKIKLCILCQGAGIYQPTDPTVEFPLVICVHSEEVPKRDRRYVHPRCYINKMGLKKLLTLPMRELETVRMGDVTKRTMRHLLNIKSFVTTNLS